MKTESLSVRVQMDDLCWFILQAQAMNIAPRTLGRILFSDLIQQARADPDFLRRVADGHNS